MISAERTSRPARRSSAFFSARHPPVTPDGGRDAIDPFDPIATAFGVGYGVQDYGATPYTDIDPQGRTGGPGSSVSAPYRNKASRVDGLLKQSKTRIAEITDGTSNTVAIAEDAGRDASFQSPYLEQDMIGSSPRGDAYIVQFNPPRNVPTGQRRYWRWADADGSFGVSTQPNNKARPMKTNGFYLPPDRTIEGNNCGANDEAFSFHPGGVNVLMGDGSVRFIKDSINIVTWRSLISRAGRRGDLVRPILIRSPPSWFVVGHYPTGHV